MLMGDTCRPIGGSSNTDILPPDKTHLRQFLGRVKEIGPAQVLPMALYINDDDCDGYFRRDEIERGIEAYLLRPDSSVPIRSESEAKGMAKLYMEKIDISTRIPATYNMYMTPYEKRKETRTIGVS